MILTRILEWIYLALTYLSSVIYYVLSSHELPSVWALIGIVLFFGAWFGSAFLSATIAEIFGHPVRKHFLLGLVMPYFYPFRLVKTLRVIKLDVASADVEQAEARLDAQKVEATNRFEEIRREREAARRARSAERYIAAGKEVPAELLEPVAEAAPEPEAEEPEETAAAAADGEVPVWQQIKDALYAQPLDAEGCRIGPYRLYLKDGGTMDVDLIRAMQEEWMVCVQSSSGKTLRVRYVNVIGVEQLEVEES